MFPMSIVYERRGRGRLAEDAERRGRVSSTPLRGYDTTPRRLVYSNKHEIGHPIMSGSDYGFRSTKPSTPQFLPT